jgi:cation diffusion facilitator family transporter
MPLLPHVPRPEARAALLAVVVSAGLLVMKLAAYFITGSTAIFSDALESVVNVLASSFAMYSLSLAHRPADAEHPYGHGKVEFLSAGFEGGMILLAAIVIMVSSIDTLINHMDRLETAGRLDVGLVIMVVAMMLNGTVGIYLIRTGRRRGAIALEADGKHLLSDAVSSAVALGALLVVRITGFRYADPIGAIVIAAYIAYLAGGLINRSAAGLMDKQDLADNEALEKILESHVAGAEPRICSFHKLRHRHSGRYHWVEFHISVPAHLNVDTGHRIASVIEHEMEEMLGEGNATAHVEPCRGDDCQVCHRAFMPIA